MTKNKISKCKIAIEEVSSDLVDLTRRLENMNPDLVNIEVDYGKRKIFVVNKRGENSKRKIEIYYFGNSSEYLLKFTKTLVES